MCGRRIGSSSSGETKFRCKESDPETEEGRDRERRVGGRFLFLYPGGGGPDGCKPFSSWLRFFATQCGREERG